jgi:hypothetical protein
VRDLNLDHSHRGAQPRLSSTGQAASIASALHLLSALFLFNQFGDLERCMLRPGNVHSGERWRDEAEAIPARRLHRDQPGATRQAGGWSARPLAAMFAVLGLVTFIPELALWLPRLAMG